VNLLQIQEFFPTLRRMLSDISHLHKSEEKNAFFIACSVAFFNQISASTSIINYAPKVQNYS
jgi:hypothetical protein